MQYTPSSKSTFLNRAAKFWNWRWCRWHCHSTPAYPHCSRRWMSESHWRRLLETLCAAAALAWSERERKRERKVRQEHWLVSLSRGHIPAAQIRSVCYACLQFFCQKSTLILHLILLTGWCACIAKRQCKCFDLEEKAITHHSTWCSLEFCFPVQSASRR